MIVELIRRVQTQGSCNDGAAMSDEDWRVEVELADGASAHRLRTAIGERELVHHARERLGDRAVLSGDGAVIFAYTSTRANAEAAQRAIAEVAGDEQLEATFSLRRWHPAEERWEDPDVPLPKDPQAVASEQQKLEEDERQDPDQHEWEVRATLPTHADAVELAEQFAREGLPSQRHWHYLLLGARTEPEAKELAERIRKEAPAGTEVRAELTFSYVLKHEPNTPLRYLSPFVPL